MSVFFRLFDFWRGLSCANASKAVLFPFHRAFSFFLFRRFSFFPPSHFSIFARERGVISSFN